MLCTAWATAAVGVNTAIAAETSQIEGDSCLSRSTRGEVRFDGPEGRQFPGLGCLQLEHCSANLKTQTSASHVAEASQLKAASNAANVLYFSGIDVADGGDAYRLPAKCRRDEPSSGLTEQVEPIRSSLRASSLPVLQEQQERRKHKMNPAEAMNERLHALVRDKVVILDCSCPSCAPGSAATSQDAVRCDPDAAESASLPRIGSIAGWRVQPNMDRDYSRSIWPKAVAEGPCSLISTESRQALTRFLARHGFEATERCGRNTFPTAFRWSEQAAAKAQAAPASGLALNPQVGREAVSPS